MRIIFTPVVHEPVGRTSWEYSLNAVAIGLINLISNPACYERIARLKRLIRTAVRTAKINT
jgi:hypothetical protein